MAKNRLAPGAPAVAFFLLVNIALAVVGLVQMYYQQQIISYKIEQLQIEVQQLKTQVNEKLLKE